MPYWAQIAVVGASVAALLLNIAIAIVGCTWFIAKIRLTVSELIEQHRTEVDEKLAVHRSYVDDKLAALAQHTGEVGSALRQKIHDVELFGRDNYVRRDSFALVVSEIKAGIAEVGKQIGDRLARIESRLMGGGAE